MSVNTVLLDFSIDPTRVCGDAECKVVVKSVVEAVKKFFTNPILLFESTCDDGFLSLYKDVAVVISIRLFRQGLLTLNIEYYRQETDAPKMSFETARDLEKIMVKTIELDQGQSLPPLQRGRLPRYFPSADERIIEYDIDKVVYDKRSEFQKIQIVHSKSLGHMLVLDELQNIAEADLIYTETLMQRGVENYKGKEICILGGGDGALLYELLKENPKYVVMLEIDELVMQACNKYMNSICGDVLEKRKDDNYEIIVADCMVWLDKYIKEGRKFDYVFGDLTDIPITDTPTGEIWNFIRSILENSFKVLKPDGKFMTHGNGASCPESLKMYEEQLNKLTKPVKYTKTSAFVPSFMEEWIFYQVSFA